MSGRQVFPPQFGPPPFRFPETPECQRIGSPCTAPAALTDAWDRPYLWTSAQGHRTEPLPGTLDCDRSSSAYPEAPAPSPYALPPVPRTLLRLPKSRTEVLSLAALTFLQSPAPTPTMYEFRSPSLRSVPERTQRRGPPAIPAYPKESPPRPSHRPRLRNDHRQTARGSR